MNKDRTASIETTKSSGETIKQVFWQTAIKELKINGIENEGFHRHRCRYNNNFTKILASNWPLQEVNDQLLGIGSLSQLNQSER